MLVDSSLCPSVFGDTFLFYKKVGGCTSVIVVLWTASGRKVKETESYLPPSVSPNAKVPCFGVVYPESHPLQPYTGHSTNLLLILAQDMEWEIRYLLSLV